MALSAFATIKELRQKLVQKEISPEEVVEFYLARLKAYDGEIDSTLHIFDKESILKEMQQGGRLHGIPGIIKNRPFLSKAQSNSFSCR